MNIKNSRQKLETASAILFALLIWQGASLLVGNRLLLVPPLVVLRVLSGLILTGSFWNAVAYSWLRITAGFLLALGTGTVLAVLAGRFHLAEILLKPWMSAVKATPVAAFIILCLIWLNARSLSIFIAFLMVLPVVYTNLLQGIRSTDRKLLEMAAVFDLGRWRRVHYIYLPQIRPYLISACAIAIGLSWKAGIAAEVIGIPDGSIGERLYEAKVYLNTGDLFAWTIAIVAVSLVFEKFFILALRQMLPGKEPHP